MKKTLLLLAVLVCTANQLFARQLSPAEALQRANGNRIAPASVASKPVFTAVENDKAFFYVFANDDNNGYMIISADDVAAPILGYADNGTFDADNIPTNMKAFLDDYKREIAWATENGISTYTAAPTATRAAIAPLMKTKWNQDAPYNNYCPEDAYGKTPTGCVATAMAQVMKYHEWPKKGTGSFSYTWKDPHNSLNQVTLSADFGATTYDWDNMLDEYTSNATAAQQDAVATLMSHLGISVQMEYDSYGSGAISSIAGKALIEYFGYDPAVSYRLRQSYTSSEWEEMLYNDLANVGPVYYDGRSKDGGHAFVCDGYKDGYFHINWGWGGMSDGYFLFSALDPDSHGIGGSSSSSAFNYDQGAMFGIKPNAGGTATPRIECNGDFGVKSRSITKSGSNYVTFKTTGSFYSVSLFDLTNFYYGVKLVSENGSTSYLQTNTAVTLNPGYGYSTYQILSTKFSTEGTFTATPAFYYNNKWYDIPTGIGNIGQLTINVTSTKITVTVPSFESGLTVSNISPKSPFYLNKGFSIDTKITCSSGEYLGDINVALFDPITDALLTTADATMINLTAGETIDFEFNSTFSSTTFNKTGSFNFAFIDNHNNVISEKYPITLNAEPKLTTISVTELRMTDGKITDVDSENISITMTLKCNSGYVSEVFELYIYPAVNGTVYPVAYDTKTAYIEAGNSASIVFNCSFEGEPGMSYFALPFCDEYAIAGTGQIIETSDALIFTLSKEAGIEAVEADAAEVKMYPNPADAEVNFEAQSDIKAIDIFALSGAKALSVTDIADSKTTIDVSTLPTGNYVVTIATADGVAVKRLIKR